MARFCDITGKRVLSGNNVSHACNKTKRLFKPNLIEKKFYLPEQDVCVVLKIAASTLRTINKNGLLATLQQAYRRGTLNPAYREFVEMLPYISVKGDVEAEQS